jgi:hypothetical protein
LIEQVLNEVSINVTKDKDLQKLLQPNFYNDLKTSGTSKQLSAKDVEGLTDDISWKFALRDVAKLNDTPPDTLDDKDFDYILNNLENPEVLTNKLISQLIAIRHVSKNADVKQKITDILNKRDELIKAKSLERQSISQPQIRTQPADSMDPKGAVFSADIPVLINKLFGRSSGENAFKDRINKITQISDTFYEAAMGDKESITALDKKGIKTFLQEIMIMDYLVEIAKSFDSGSGGYLFEWFLAMIFGGSVTGKSKGPGGGMGAVDFKTADNLPGSSKYYKDKSGIEQAASGFNIGEKVKYIIAIKKADAAQFNTPGKGESDPAKLIAIDIYLFDVMRSSDTKFTINKKNYNIKSEDEKLPLGKFLPSSPVGTIHLSVVNTRSFRDMVYDAVKTEATSLKKDLLESFEKIFQNLEDAEANCRIYSMTGRIGEANKTIGNINLAKDNFQELVPKVNPKLNFDDKTQTVATKQAGPLVQEKNQKKSLKDLDKLIERVILDKMNK